MKPCPSLAVLPWLGVSLCSPGKQLRWGSALACRWFSLAEASPREEPPVWTPSPAFRGPVWAWCFGTRSASGGSSVTRWQSWWAPIMLTSAF